VDECATLLSTTRWAAGRPNAASKLAISVRMSEAPGLREVASSGTATVSPVPSIPWLSSGSMP
jgi:hypothetical protein